MTPELRALERQHAFLVSAAAANRFDPVAYDNLLDAARTKAHEIAECEARLRAFDIPPVPPCAEIVSLAAVRARMGGGAMIPACNPRPAYAALMITLVAGVQRQAEQERREVPNTGSAIGEAGALIAAYEAERSTSIMEGAGR